MPLTINFIGCGRVGKTLAWLINANAVARIGSIYNSTYSSSVQASQFIGAGDPVREITSLVPSDIYFMTTRDDIISELCAALVSNNMLKKGAVLLHCSGALCSDTLNQAKSHGCHIASVHPLKSFANPNESIETFSGTHCAIEGDPEAIRVLNNLFTGIGGKIFSISKEKKRLYHAASVMANNYLVALHYQAVQCYLLAGVEAQTANILTTQMMDDALKNLKNYSHETSLTGPLQRGDINTVRDHVETLTASNTLLSAIYCQLGLGTLPLTQHNSVLRENLVAVLKAGQDKR
jgi:predicted short-subunit dehydrogenase-like oxidoreductase (DUF2520 family)